MGCDIHSHAERRNASGAWEKIEGLEPFDWRSYRIYGFLANVRNYSAVPPISEPRGLPEDASPEVVDQAWNRGWHSHVSWLSVEELTSFNYEATFEDRRVARRIGLRSWDGGRTCKPGEDAVTTFREFLGQAFFDELAKLQDAGAERVVFWFDD